MPISTTYITACMVLVLSLLLTAKTGMGQEAAPSVSAPAQAVAAAYLGYRRCSLCHSSKGTQANPADFVRLNEYDVWLAQDRHAKAFRVLNDTLSKQIGQTLGIDAPRDRRCLGCHSPLFDRKGVPPEEIGAGVTCEACHGPSSNWLIPHSEKSWRKKSSAEKRGFGMLDVRDPVVRAQQCFSCHIGDAARGRVITHEMYAAGHPPLPAIEIEAFSRRMPAHWQAVEKGAKVATLSSLMALRQSVALFAGQRTGDSSKASWPDFALYDCVGCHHDLGREDWRQKRGYRGTAGFPQMWEWPEILGPLSVLYAASSEAEHRQRLREYKRKIGRLHAAVNARPFGDPRAIGNPGDVNAAAGEVIAYIDSLARRIRSTPYDRERGIDSLNEMWNLHESGQAYPSFAEARLIAWASLAIYRGIRPKPASDEEIRAVFDELSELLKLDPRSSDATLEAASTYDPEIFKTRLARLSELLRN